MQGRSARFEIRTGVKVEQVVGEETHNGEAHNECPCAGLGVELERCPHAHPMLEVLAINGIAHEIFIDLDVGVNVNVIGLLNLIDVLHLILWLGYTCRHFGLFTLSARQAEGNREGSQRSKRGKWRVGFLYFHAEASTRVHAPHRMDVHSIPKSPFPKVRVRPKRTCIQQGVCPLMPPHLSAEGSIRFSFRCSEWRG